MTDIFEELDHQIARMGGTWTAYLVRALWPYPAGLSRVEALDSVLDDALNRGRNVPKSFKDVLQATFQKHNRGSAVFSGPVRDDIFEFVGGQYSGVWGLHRPKALAWMAANGRACDFAILPG